MLQTQEKQITAPHNEALAKKIAELFSREFSSVSMQISLASYQG
jgi:hypothetical protein